MYKYGELVAEHFQRCCDSYCLWGDLAKIDLRKTNSSERIAVIDFMEKKGFIISTETGPHEISYKPSSTEIEVQDDLIEVFVCVMKSEHEHER
jgi:hypothetical protein